MFADDYPRFMELNELNPRPQRFSQRYEAMFAANRDMFEGARVLDLASHDGRWSFAALKTGAAHVTGVEVRESLIEKAQDAFAYYGQDPDTYRFVCGDVFEVLAREKFDVDVVLLLGYLYHTYRHTELMYRIHELAPRHLLVDTMVARGREQSCRVFRERDSEGIRSAAQDAYSVGRVLVAWPTLPALRMLLGSYGFEAESMYDWKSRLAGLPRTGELSGYAKGKRVTLRCRARQPGSSGEWKPAAIAPVTSGPRRKPRRRPNRTPAQPPQPTKRWREIANRGLAKVTGYELRRASPRVAGRARNRVGHQG